MTLTSKTLPGPYYKIGPDGNMVLAPNITPSMNDSGYYVATPEGDYTQAFLNPGAQDTSSAIFNYDPQRKLHFLRGEGGKKNYLSPTSFGGKVPDGGSFLKSSPQWDKDKGEWETKTNWGNLMGVGIGGTIAAPFALSALGIGGAAAPTASATGGMLGPTSAASMAGTAAALAPPTALASTAGTGAAGMGFLDFLFKPGMSDLIGTGANFAGGLLQGNQNQKNINQQLLQQSQQNQQSREDSMKAALASFLQSQQSLATGQANTGLAATQMNPYSQAQDLNRLNVQRAMGNALSSGQGVNLDMSALAPSNLTRHGDQFYSNVATANPNTPIGGMSTSAEAQRQATLAKQKELQDWIMQYLQSIGAPTKNPISLVPGA